MIFDERYILNLAIKISDVEMINKTFNRTRINPLFEKELYDNISKYTYDPQIYSIFDLNKPNYENNKDLFTSHLTNMINNPNDNTEMIVKFLRNFKEKNLNNFLDEKRSIITSTIKYPFSYNKKKKLINLFFLDFHEKGKYSELADCTKAEKISSFFSGKKTEKKFEENENLNVDLNMKNAAGLTNSKILSDEDPTLLDSLFLEDIENLTKNKNSENFYLFKKRHFYFLPYENKNENWNFFGLFGSGVGNNEDKIKKDFEDFIDEEKNSAKVNYNDIEFKLFMLNNKLRSMFEIKTFSDNGNDINGTDGFNKLHVRTLEKFMFENILLEKI